MVWSGRDEEEFPTNAEGIPIPPSMTALPKLLHCLSMGGTLADACAVAGIQPFSFWYRCRKHPQVMAAYEIAAHLGALAIGQQCIELAKGSTDETINRDRFVANMMTRQAERMAGGRNSSRTTTVNVDARAITVGSAIAELASRRKVE